MPDDILPIYVENKALIKVACTFVFSLQQDPYQYWSANEIYLPYYQLSFIRTPISNRENRRIALIKIALLINHSIKTHQPVQLNKLIAIKDSLTFAEKLNRKTLNSLSLILQPLLLLTKSPTVDTKKTVWLSVAIHTFLLLAYHRRSKTHLQTIINRFKLPVFSKSKNNTWIWNILPTLDKFNSLITEPDFIYLFFAGQLSALENEQQARELLSISKESEETIKLRKKKINQIKAIVKALDQAYHPNKKITRERSKKTEKGVKEIEYSSIGDLADDIDDFKYGVTWVDNTLWNTDSYDIETPSLYLQYPYYADTDYASYAPNSFKPRNIEEYVDSLEQPLLLSKALPDKTVRFIASLQGLEKNIQHSYISQRAFEMNSNIRILSKAGMQQVFVRLIIDTSQPNLNDTKTAAILLLSMMTALPVQHLLQPNFIKKSGLFLFLKDKVYLQHDLRISDRKQEFDSSTHQNEMSIIRLPMLSKLIEFVSYRNNLPKQTEILKYIKVIKDELRLPYLSVARIEATLHVLLHRYVEGSNQHIADLICRIPAPLAPAIYYSSHDNQTLVKLYLQAVKLLDYDNQLQLIDSHLLSEELCFTTGSGFALTVAYVKDFLEVLTVWVANSENEKEHFNRYSSLVWIQFCLLTGTRPNNGLTNVEDIDLTVGWYQVTDKPSKVVKNHRLIPLCSTLISLLQSYKLFLLHFQNYVSEDIARVIHIINKEQDDLTLINLLSNNYDAISEIKRGDISKILAEFMPFPDPYWTRHFVRTQLELHKVSMVLINSIIGHEKNRQEGLGCLSSISKQQIWQVRDTFEKIAQSLEVTTSIINMRTSRS